MKIAKTQRLRWKLGTLYISTKTAQLIAPHVLRGNQNVLLVKRGEWETIRQLLIDQFRTNPEEFATSTIEQLRLLNT